jgi:hypothetical protein
MMFIPNIQQMTTPIKIQHRSTQDINGADEISYTSETDINFCNWKGMGGSESTESGASVVKDTAILIMWFSPLLSEKDRVLLNDNETLAYEVDNVENIEQRDMFLRVKVTRVVSA